jgi:4-alpha-glucanotransferase
MGSDRSALERLATLAGVLPSYEDVYGKTIAASTETLRSILRALGLEASSEADAARLADALEARPWLEGLDDVTVCDVGASSLVTISHPAEVRSGRVWRLIAEDGTHTEGSFALASLALVDRKEIDGTAYERREFALPKMLTPGYYRFELEDPDGHTVATTIVLAPEACWLPDPVERRGVWGLAIQLYALRSERSWGIGDFTDLATLCEIVDAAGGSAVGVNPLHELHFGASSVPSPYSPTSRAFLNWIYLDVEALPGFDLTAIDATALARVRASALVDYAAVSTLKRTVARRAFANFSTSEASGERAEFDTFVREGGEALWRSNTFAALRAHFDRETGRTADWMSWPEPFRNPDSEEVRAFARERADDVAFEAFLQWQCDEQLARCTQYFSGTLGLYRDLAVGADLASSDTWANRGVLTRAAAVGAPPDVLNVRGQNWGVAPFDPIALRRAAYAPFVALLRANMRHAGALRIDHVMALARLYWVPTNSSPTDGAYVSYRLDELLGIVALESQRARCAVIGEDLGTVPDGFREKLAAKNILSYRLLQFERDDAGFAKPEDYPNLALVSIGTHDLPPLGAYWTGTDIATRFALGLLPEGTSIESLNAARDVERDQLIAAFEAHGLIEVADARRYRAATQTPEDTVTLAEISRVANRYLSRTTGRLLMVQLEDVLGSVEQANVPTTVDEHPNWRRRSPLKLEKLAIDPRFVALCEDLRSERGALHHR